MKNIHYFPKTIKILNNNKTIEIDFNIEQMIPEFLINEFGLKTIINAIDELGISYSELTSISTTSSNYKNSCFDKYYDIINIEYVSKLDNNGNKTNSYYKFTSYEFSLVSKGSELLTKLICDKYSYLSEFKTKKIVKFIPYKFINGFNKLSDIPEEFRNYTVNELISMTSIQEKEVEVSLCKIYTSGLSNFDNYEFYLDCPELINKQGNFDNLYIPYNALKEKDFSIIYNRTKSYLESYYTKDISDRLKVLTCNTALKLKELMS